jgi:hypothetical protein
MFKSIPKFFGDFYHGINVAAGSPTASVVSGCCIGGGAGEGMCGTYTGIFRVKMVPIQ